MSEKLEPVLISAAEPLRRFATIRAEDVSADDNTFQIAASSEFPVQRTCDKAYAAIGIAKEGEKFWEVLSHAEGDVDLTRFNPPNKASFLDEHTDTRHLGPITRATLSKDKVVRIVASCDGISQLSQTRAAQIKAESRPNVSIGYKHTAYLGKRTLDDGRIGHFFAWAGLETSSVGVPADPTVGVFRAADKKCHCFSCGGAFERAELNRVDGAFVCGDCEAAEAPAKRGEESGARIQKPECRGEPLPDAEKFTRFEAAMKDKKWGKADDFIFSRKKDEQMEEISFSELRSRVTCAVDADKRLKAKRPNNDTFCPYYVSDILCDPENGTWKAILCNCYEGGYLAVAFERGPDGYVTLGEAVAVQPVTEFQPVEAARNGRAASVDSPNPVTTGTPDQQPQPIKPMADKTEKDIRSEERQNVLTEFKEQRAAESTKIAERNKEILARADEAVKTHGHKWNGKSGEKYVVSERIRKLASDICLRSAEVDARECRMDFTAGLQDLIAGAHEPKVQHEAAHLADELASRVSLRNLYNGAAKAAARGDKSTCWLPTEGAEKEAHDEIKHRAQEFPGGLGCDISGVLIPSNAPIARTNVSDRMARRMTRDSLAGDFQSAGALISPEYKFPIIELLRNKMALGNAGMTVLSGVVGNLVLPRQTSPTTSQSVAEGAALTAYDQTFDQIQMRPHRVGSTQAYSRLALLQSGTDFEALVYQDHIAQNALRCDQLGLNGSGNNSEPLGILNQVGIGSVLFSGSAANAYKNLIALETLIRKANIDEAPTYITTSTARGTLRITPATLTGSTVVSGQTQALWVGDELAGRSAVDSQQVLGDVLVALVGRHLVFAQWGGWQITLDTLTQANKDKIVLSMNTYIDYALRHPQAVARSVDSLAVLS